MSSSSESSSSENTDSSSSSSSPHLFNSDPLNPANQDSSSETLLIDTLKKSLKLTNNKFLESEIEDLKEFFTVQLNEDCEYNDNTTTAATAGATVLWLQVYLPITIRTIQEDDGKEVINNCKPLISLKIELKSEVMESQDETTLPYSITDFKVEELEEEDKDSVDIKDSVDTEETDSTDTDSSANVQSNSRSVLNSILSTLLESKDISLLNLIEDFYIHLEDSNYPAKEVICRDYYYPVFDSRHWGRSNIKNSSSSGCTTNNLFTLLSCNTTGNISINLTNSPTTSTSSTSVVYRARALYDFQALMQGELSFQENEILLVLANLGNGWLTARRLSSGDNGGLDSDDVMIGLIPENYIERL